MEFKTRGKESTGIRLKIQPDLGIEQRIFPSLGGRLSTRLTWPACNRNTETETTSVYIKRGI